MAELAGLVLGVAAALVPAYEGYQKCNTIIAETRNFPRGFRTFKQSLLTQRLIFNNEYELLLKEIVLDNTILQRMLKDQNHEHWIDPNFQKAFCSYFGVVSLDDKLTPFKVIREVLDEITHEVLELERRVESIPNSVGQKKYLGLRWHPVLTLSDYWWFVCASGRGLATGQKPCVQIRLGIVQEGEA